MPRLPLTTSVILCFYSRTESFGLLDKPSFQYDHSDDPVSIKSRHKDWTTQVFIPKVFIEVILSDNQSGAHKIYTNL